MTVNIFTDASVSPTRNAAYAFYIGSRGVKIQRAGVLKVKTDNSTVAELHCICNALHTLFKSPIQGVTKIVVHSDSLACVDALAGLKPAPNGCAKEVRDLFILMTGYALGQGIKLGDVERAFSFTHVKAHTKGKDKHTLLNAWCDREAKRWRKWSDKVAIYPGRTCTTYTTISK